MDEHAPTDRQPWLRISLFDADGQDRDLDEGDIDVGALGEHQLLWVVLQYEDADEGAAEACLERLIETKCLQDGLDALHTLNCTPQLLNLQDRFLVHVNVVEGNDKLHFANCSLPIAYR